MVEVENTVMVDKVVLGNTALVGKVAVESTVVEGGTVGVNKEEHDNTLEVDKVDLNTLKVEYK